MLDIKVIREQAEAVEKALRTRGMPLSLKEILKVDDERREKLQVVEALKAERNVGSHDIGLVRRRGEDAVGAMARMGEIGERIKAIDAEVKGKKEQIDAMLLQLPNLPHSSVPVGSSTDENRVVRQWSQPRGFSFAPKAHWDLGEALGILDFKRAAKTAKSRFTILWGMGARLERALVQFMLDLHTREHGYQEVWVPHLVNANTMLGTAQLPKFEEQLFKTVDAEEGRELYLIPTAEVPLTALHADEVLPADSLPRKYVAFTPCYRREAGTYGKDTKGMIRQHQFDKVELVKITTPETSYDELETMVEDAEEVLKRLELPYRVVLLCSGDMGFAAAKTYDLEVWLPEQGRYREISSCSNCEAFQARRLKIRYRGKSSVAFGPPGHVHTLNGSGLAVGRTLIAILENCQEADGSVVIPGALRPYMDGLERIAK
jgi:seryl-tRNA synthetase